MNKIQEAQIIVKDLFLRARIPAKEGKHLMTLLEEQERAVNTLVNAAGEAAEQRDCCCDEANPDYVCSICELSKAIEALDAGPCTCENLPYPCRYCMAANPERVDQAKN